MCRSLKVLCAAPDRERLTELKRAAVGVHWELVGGAITLQDVESQVAEWRPDVVVLDAALGVAAVQAARRARSVTRLVGLGRLAGCDVEVASLEEVRQAILELPTPGGPVRA